MEHRCGHRVEADVPVRVTLLPATIGWGNVLNVSATGAFVRTSLRLPVLSLVYLEPTLKGQDAWPLDSEPMEALVVWRNGDGAGLEWCEPSDQLLEEMTSSTSWRPLVRPSTAADLSIQR